jgi:hypothetical protein
MRTGKRLYRHAEHAQADVHMSQLVLVVNVPKNLGAISGRSSSSVGILQMARQVTLRHHCFLLTCRPESFEIINVFILQKSESEQDSKHWM